MLRILISRIDSLGKHADSLKSRSFQSAIQIVQIVAAQLHIRKIPEVRNPVPTLALGEQKSAVRCGNQTVVVCRTNRKISNAKTRAGLMLRKVDFLVQTFDSFTQPVGRLDGVRSSNLRHYDDEFRAAVPGYIIHVTTLLAENSTDVTKHRISLLMAKLVIYLLEEIEIYHYQGEEALLTPCPVDFVVKVSLEMTVVPEPCQAICIRHFLGFFVMLLKLRVLALKLVMSITQHVLFFTKRPHQAVKVLTDLTHRVVGQSSLINYAFRAAAQLLGKFPLDLTAAEGSGNQPATGMLFSIYRAAGLVAILDFPTGGDIA